MQKLLVVLAVVTSIGMSAGVGTFLLAPAGQQPVETSCYGDCR